ncbi:MAG: hypothetical protein H6581_04975 [Bacteroidia bacterium]|nr:hypothetical protein [Bacteroidia bacterium]
MKNKSFYLLFLVFFALSLSGCLEKLVPEINCRLLVYNDTTFEQKIFKGVSAGGNFLGKVPANDTLSFEIHIEGVKSSIESFYSERGTGCNFPDTDCSENYTVDLTSGAVAQILVD